MTKPYNRYVFGKHRVVEEKKERSSRKRIIAFLFVFALSCLFFILFLRSPYFAIEKITVQGLNNLLREEVIAAMGIKEGTSLWEVSPPELEKRILSLPSVKKAGVERILPRSLDVFVEEKEPLALVPYQHYYLELSESGTFLGIREQMEGDLPIINGLTWGRMEVGKKVPDPVRKKILTEILQQISSLKQPAISEINVHDPERIVLYTMDGLEVLLGEKGEIPRKMTVLSKVYMRLDQEILDSGYLDLRAAEAPVFKPFPGEKNN